MALGDKAGFETEEELDRDVIKWINYIIAELKRHKVKVTVEFVEEKPSGTATER